ncbi:MAG: SUMF1/EgtB/PvdO family nonheme iron enzyme, partial [Microcystaceae cyanobacterium]
LMGSDQAFAMDNEQPQHQVCLESYKIDSHPITQQEYLEFIEAGGYQKAQFWSEEGWQWRKLNNITQPLYWLEKDDFINYPVHGVSYYEAQAYATFKGKRLPTEAEWEKASYHPNFSPKIPNFSWESDIPGQGVKGGSNSVWEWTNSWFAPYQDFQPYPYLGYSQVYFDQQHRVLRGGSWVTRPWALRNTFRNWYHPWVREIFVGFRCAE